MAKESPFIFTEFGEFGVEVIHVPSGTKVSNESTNSRGKNKNEALLELKALLAKEKPQNTKHHVFDAQYPQYFIIHEVVGPEEAIRLFLGYKSFGQPKTIVVGCKVAGADYDTASFWEAANLKQMAGV